MVIQIEEELTAECSVDTVSRPSPTRGRCRPESVGATVPNLAVDCAPVSTPTTVPASTSSLPRCSGSTRWYNTFVITFETEWITIQAITNDSSWTPPATVVAVADPGLVATSR